MKHVRNSAILNKTNPELHIILHKQVQNIIPTKDTLQNAPVSMDGYSPDWFYKQVERYFQDINMRLNGSDFLTEVDKRCSMDVRVMEMCLRNVMTLDLSWRADISLEYWVKNVQAIWREGDRDQTLEEFDIIKSIAVLSRHFKDHMHNQIDLVSNERTYNWEGYLHIRDFVNRGEQILSLFDLMKEVVAVEALKIKHGRINAPPTNLIWQSTKALDLSPDPPPYSPNPPNQHDTCGKLDPEPEYESTPNVSETRERLTRWPTFPS